MLGIPLAVAGVPLVPRAMVLRRSGAIVLGCILQMDGSSSEGDGRRDSVHRRYFGLPVVGHRAAFWC